MVAWSCVCLVACSCYPSIVCVFVVLIGWLFGCRFVRVCVCVACMCVWSCLFVSLFAYLFVCVLVLLLACVSIWLRVA